MSSSTTRPLHNIASNALEGVPPLYLSSNKTSDQVSLLIPLSSHDNHAKVIHASQSPLQPLLRPAWPSFPRRQLPQHNGPCLDPVPSPISLHLGKQVSYRRRDKGMPNGCSFNWESMAMRERKSLETHCVESLLVVYVCVLAISNRCQKTVPPPIRG